jgi:hypothetical protein
MALMAQLRSARPTSIVQPAKQSDESVVAHVAGRLIQITLALYLLPALLIVLAVGGIGIFIIKTSQLITGPVKRSPG